MHNPAYGFRVYAGNLLLQRPCVPGWVYSLISLLHRPTPFPAGTPSHFCSFSVPARMVHFYWAVLSFLVLMLQQTLAKTVEISWHLTTWIRVCWSNIRWSLTPANVARTSRGGVLHSVSHTEGPTPGIHVAEPQNIPTSLEETVKKITSCFFLNELTSGLSYLISQFQRAY